MKIKYSWIISFCLMLFFTFFSFSNVFASTSSPFDYEKTCKSYVDMAITDTLKQTEINSYKNIWVVYKSYTTTTKDEIVYQGFYICNNDSSLSLTRTVSTYYTLFYSSGSSVYAFSTRVCPGIKNVYSVNQSSNGANIEGNITSSGFVVKGSVYLGSVAPPVIFNDSVSDSDILNFSWSGNGLKIYNLKSASNISGYIDNTIKYFDIECYGKFIYKGSNTYFTSFAYKKNANKYSVSQLYELWK